MTDKRNHALFRQFPIEKEMTISTGTVPVPYHVYDGHGMLICGTVNGQAAASLLAGEDVLLTTTRGRRGLMAVWVCDFSEASLGPHHELQFSLCVSFKPTDPASDEPLGLLHALVTNGDVGMFCHGLWNDSETAVSYNRELLGLPAQLSDGTITRQNGKKVFELHNNQGELLVSGTITEQKRPSWAVTRAIFKQFGLWQSLKMAAAPYLNAAVINPKGTTFGQNRRAFAAIAANAPVVQFWDTAVDHIRITAEPYHSLDFEPLFVEHFSPFRFVYLLPQPPQPK